MIHTIENQQHKHLWLIRYATKPRLQYETLIFKRFLLV